MIIEIAGHGTINSRLAHDLISDFTQGSEVTFYIPESEKRRTPIMWELPRILEDMDDVTVLEKEEEDQADILFILDQYSDADLIGEYQDAGKPVYDLCLALYPVTGYDANI